MAHECPNCGMRCHCKGDIGDIVFPDNWHEANCICCQCSACKKSDFECECDYELYDDYDNDPPEPLEQE